MVKMPSGQSSTRRNKDKKLKSTSLLKETHGFFPRTLRYCEKFYILYKDSTLILQRLVAQLSSVTASDGKKYSACHINNIFSNSKLEINTSVEKFDGRVDRNLLV